MEKEKESHWRSPIFLFTKSFHPSFLQPNSVSQEHLHPWSHYSVSLDSSLVESHSES